jgi:DNA replication protein
MNNLMQEKNFVIPAYILDAVKKLNLDLNEFLLLIYFWNQVESPFDISLIAKEIHLDETIVLSAFNSLLKKKIITLDTVKDSNKKCIEVVNLQYFYAMISESLEINKEEKESADIYSTFEKEFGRPISSMEYEIIRAWIEKGFSEELILGALKEAVYNGVNNLRYIDKILYEWQRKGYKNMKDVTSRKVTNDKEVKPLFDYNWLDDNE